MKTNNEVQFTEVEAKSYFLAIQNGGQEDRTYISLVAAVHAGVASGAPFHIYAPSGAVVAFRR